MDGFEVSHDFPGLGPRTMLLNARKVLYDTSPDIAILLAFTDVTEQRAIEKTRDDLHARTGELLLEKHTLLQEMEHRVANSLQIIASILMLKARLVTSEETRQHLRDAHQRVMSVATVQSHLHATDGIEVVDVGPYLVKLCESLAASMIGDQPILLQVMADEGKVSSAHAVSMGLIVTELVINALKYAFPADKAGSLVMVTYESKGDDWKLVVSDNGVGDKAGKNVITTKGGLGTVIVKALVKRLDAQMEMTSTPAGMSVAVTHATFTSNMPRAA
jgi:chemotaxis protein methyltransferase CheR